jgi:hypothetical protein
MNETKGDIKMVKYTKTMDLARELQVLAHEYGYEVFRDAVAKACLDASGDTEDFEDKSLTQKYRFLANRVKDAEDNEPVFSKHYIED